MLEYGTSADGEAAARLVSRTLDAGGLAIINRVGYDAFGYDATTVDGNGQTTAKTINAVGAMESETVPEVDGAIAQYVLHYDGDRRVDRVQRPRGDYADARVAGEWIEDVIHRDVLGHPIRSEFGANTVEPRVFRSAFDFRGFPVTIEAPDGSRCDRAYDERGLLIEETATGADGLRLTTRRAYDRTGRLIRLVAPSGATTIYRYDGFGRLIRTTGPTGSEVRSRWLAGDVLQSVETAGEDGRGTVRRLEMVSFGYDERLRQTTESVQCFADDPSAAVEATTTFHHDSADRVTRLVDPRGGTTLIHYDGMGRIAARIDPLGNEERYGYDPNGNPVRVQRHHREPGGTTSVHVTTCAYDARNRRTAIGESDGSSITFAFDARDLLITRTDQLGRSRHITYNAFGDRVEESYYGAGPPILHRWKLDAMARPVAYTDPTGENSTYRRDGLGRVVEITYPSGLSSLRTYAGTNIVAEELGGGARFTYRYDSCDRLTSITNNAPGPTSAPVAAHAFAYDGLGRVTTASVGPDVVLRDYDSRGRITREDGGGTVLAAAYDDLKGEMLKRWPDGRVERHRHDLGGALASVEEIAHGALGDAGAQLASFAPSGPSHFGEARYRGDLRVAAVYDERKRLTALRARAPAGLAETVEYRYDTTNARRVEAFTGAAPRLRYVEHDAKQRITVVRDDVALGPGGGTLPAASTQTEHDAAVALVATASATAPQSETFAYDAADARLEHARTGHPMSTYAYLPGHRLQTDGVASFAYSADATIAADGRFIYTADALGRIVTIADGARTIYRIDYDAFGRPRTLAEAGRPVRGLHYLGARVEQETDDGVAVRQSTQNSGTGAPIAYHVPGATHYTLFDGRMNLVGLADTGGGLLEAYRYEAFGRPTVLDPAGAVRPASQFGVEPVFGGQRYLPSVGRYLAGRRLNGPRARPVPFARPTRIRGLGVALRVCRAGSDRPC